MAGRCAECGSDRVRPAGLGVERVRDELSGVLGAQVGLITADERERADAPMVVGNRTPDRPGWGVGRGDPTRCRRVLFGASGIGAVERAFRLFYRAAEAARKLLLVQTRLPEHYALRAGVRGDYERSPPPSSRGCARSATRLSRTWPR